MSERGWSPYRARPGGTRLTAEGGRDFGAEWTPDGLELIYISEHPFFDLYRVARGTPLHLRAQQVGRYRALDRGPPGRARSQRYLRNGFNLAHPVLSPDGRWMAYDSDEAGRVEVFAQSYPDPNRKRWWVSLAHGSEPMWTRGDRELVYRNGDSVMAGTIDPENGLSGQPKALFAGPYPDNPGWTRPRSYDVSADGERFLLIRLPDDAPPHRVEMVVNWFDEFRAKMTVK